MLKKIEIGRYSQKSQVEISDQMEENQLIYVFKAFHVFESIHYFYILNLKKSANMFVSRDCQVILDSALTLGRVGTQ